MRKLASFVLGAVALFSTSAAFAITETTLHSLDSAAEGFSPSHLLAGDDGNFYGVASRNVSGASTVFKLTPAGLYTQLATFDAPVTVLSKGITGNLFGVVRDTTTSNSKTLFRLTPAGALTVLHTFVSTDSVTGVTALIQGADGRLYGVGGGQSQSKVFAFAIGTGTLIVLHTFNDSSEGSGPRVLIQAANGTLYGSTGSGGANQNGTSFRISTSGTFAVLNSLGFDSLIQGADGNFYGTWQNIFGLEADENCGYVYKMTPAGALTTLAGFNCLGLAVPERLVQAADGTLYGTARGGGALSGDGSIFRLTTAGKIARVYHFGYVSGGAHGHASPLTLGQDGNLYVATLGGGAQNAGAVFRLSGYAADAVNISPFLGSSEIVQEQVCRTARVLDANNAARANAPVTFVRSGANPATASTTTDASGVATHCWTGIHPGIDVVSARISGSDERSAVSWSLRPTHLATDGYIHVISPANVELHPGARLTDARTGAPLVGRVVHFTFDASLGRCPPDPYSLDQCFVGNYGELCSATTDATGYAQCRTVTTDHLDVLLAGDYQSAFAGDSIYQPTLGSGKLR